MADFFPFGDTELETGEKGGRGGIAEEPHSKLENHLLRSQGGGGRTLGSGLGGVGRSGGHPREKKGQMKEIPVFGRGPTHSPLWGGREELG